MLEGLKYTSENDSKTIAEDIIDLFPDTSLNDLESIIQRYKDADSWLKDTFISEKSFINLEDMMIDANLLDKYVSFNDLIVNE